MKPCLESSLHNSADVAFGISDFLITVFQTFGGMLSLSTLRAACGRPFNLVRVRTDGPNTAQLVCEIWSDSY